ncbi:MAG: putative Ig domain-containing protein [Miltoncostaeaceae bacterium]
MFGLAACGGDEPVAEPLDAGVEATASAEGLDFEEPELADDGSANSEPRIEYISFEPEEPSAGDTVRAVVETSDADGDRIWLAYEWTLDGDPVGDDDEDLSLEGAEFSRGSTLEVSVVATDGKDEDSDSESVEIVNAVPELVSVEVIPDGDLLSGEPITLRPEARDADGDEIIFRYEWEVNGREIRAEGPVLESDRLRRGDEVQARVYVADEDDESEPFETPVFTIANSPPKVVSRPSDASADGTFRYQVEASDPDGDRHLQYHLENEPDGMKINPTRGSVVWTPAPDQTGDYQISVIVDDLRGGKTRHTFEVNVDPPAKAPPASRGSRAQ